MLKNNMRGSRRTKPNLSALSTSGTERIIPGGEGDKNERAEMLELGLRRCKDCKDYKMIYFRGLCKECSYRPMTLKKKTL